MDIQKNDKTYIANTYARFPVTLVKGKGSRVTDENGKEYIDMGSGIGVTAFGIADDVWKDAVTGQLNSLQHMSNLYYTSPCVRLAELLCKRTGMKKVFFCNSGAEANEGAIKGARKYAAEKKGPQYYNIITLKNSFHGRTLTTLAATGQDVFHKLFQPLTPGFIHVEAGDIEAMRLAVKENPTAGIMIEVIQGEGGVNVLAKDYVQAVAKLCEEEDIILIVDEVQTGNGRTGKLYAYMNYDIQPDIVSTAKGIGGGLPLGAVLFGAKTQDVLGPGDHGSTFGGNPVCCAGALSILERLDDDFLSSVREKSAYVFNTLKGCEGIEGVYGMGLMIGIKTVRPAKEIVNRCIENGVLCLTAKDKVRLLPALNIPMEDLKQAISVIKDAAKEGL
ncbi:MAG: aspartate aminotransferase family protein [Solobacterium sp.]|nr:aspartate aminotransferase family protein [Solobacterium sp.]